jgi:oxaloacetate decarboxylase
VKSTNPRTQLRALLASDRCVQMATVFDPISTRIAEDLGHQVGLMGGSIVSHVVLGAPDVMVLTLTELAEQLGRCTRVSSLPIIVDGDHGYGNALNAMRAVVELDRAGAGAVMIEDTRLPRAFGRCNAPALISHEESSGKLRAAVKARGDSDLVVLGRTSAPSVSNVDDAILRLRAFESAGVDALFLPKLNAKEDLDRISSAVTLPLILADATGPFSDLSYLASRNVRLWSAGHHVFALAVNALYDAMKATRDGTLPARPAGAAFSEVMDRLLRVRDYQVSTEQFLGGEPS